MQRYVIIAGEPHGVPLKFKLMPQMFADNLGYKTHAVGKWHLGYHRKAYLPTSRGFLSHFGYWNGMQDYYDHSVMNNKVHNSLIVSKYFCRIIYTSDLRIDQL